MPTFSTDIGIPLGPVVHVIRMALTPVFLLLSIAALLNVFSSRLALVGDRTEQVLQSLEAADADQADVLKDQLVHLRWRSLTLDGAVILAAVAKFAVWVSVLLLFIGKLGNKPLGLWLLMAFGLATICTLGAILAYAAEMLMAGTGIRSDLAHGHRRFFLGRRAR